jgi:hypothetical protein
VREINIAYLILMIERHKQPAVADRNVARHRILSSLAKKSERCCQQTKHQSRSAIFARSPRPAIPQPSLLFARFPLNSQPPEANICNNLPKPAHSENVMRKRRVSL